MELGKFSRRAFIVILSLACSPLVSQAGPPEPLKIHAVSQSGSGFVTRSGAIDFYDISSIESGSASGVYGDTPLFSVWLGFEILEGIDGFGTPTGNQEDPSALTVNPANGTIYVAGFDNTAGAGADPGELDEVGDGTGDYDLYRINYQAILKDFVDNQRSPGAFYAPEYLPINAVDEEFATGSLFDGTADGKAFGIPHPAAIGSTIFLPNSVEKIGELARAQPPGSFFDPELEFVDPATLVMLDANTQDTPEGDFQLRIWQRVSSSPGLATVDANGPDNIAGNDDDEQGGRNNNTTESWESAIAGRLGLDPGGATAADPRGMALVNQEGVLGVWVADSDGEGDDLAFFELDLSGPTPTATRKELFRSGGASPATVIQIDEDPSIDTGTNDGESNQLFVDADGNLVIVEPGYFDTDPGGSGQTGNMDEPAEEIKVITVGIADYDSPDSDSSGIDEILPAGPAGTGFNDTDPYSVSANLPVAGANDNDTTVTGAFSGVLTSVTYDKGTGLLYIIDEDSGFAEDIYVFDPATGQIVYSEFTPFDIGFVNADIQAIFLRGDINGDGTITYADIDQLSDAIGDPTQGGKFSSSVGQEFYDLTGDGLLTESDLLELVENILGTSLGDFDLDGDVDGDDLTEWRSGYGGTFDGGDFLQWQLNIGSTNMPGSLEAVPEPSAIVLSALCALAVLATKRQVFNS